MPPKKKPAPAAPALDVDAIASLAINPKEGKPYTFGGRQFRIQFLNCDGEQALVELVMPRIKGLIERGESSHDATMAALRDILPDALGIILSDQQPDCDAKWVRSVREPRVSLKMYDIVAATFEVTELGKFLFGLLQTDAMQQAMAEVKASSSPRTSRKPG